MKNSSQKSPILQLDSGLEIGYTGPLARFADAVELGAGNHFLLARNGRGKTTLLRTITRSLKPIAGHFHTQGFMQYLPEDLRFDPVMTPALIFKSLLPKKCLGQALDLAHQIELDVKKPYGRLSTGNRRKTNLITAEFSVKADQGNILLLDEPFSGLDAFTRQVFEEIWLKSAENVLRLVSCHPDYDSMVMPSALMIDGKNVRYIRSEGQTWSQLKMLMN